MATTRPFTRNTGSVISGTEQLVNLAIGISQQEYANNLGGVKWWMGPDEDLGYIVTKEVPSGTQPNPVSSNQATVAFSRSSIKTELSFVEMVNGLFSQNFTTGNQAKTWLNSNGYWTSWGAPSEDQFTIYFDVTASPTTGWSSQAFACAGTGTPLTVYITGNATSLYDAVVTQGKALYTNSGRTTLLNGSNTWYKTVSSPGAGEVFQVGSAGETSVWGGACGIPPGTYSIGQAALGGKIAYILQPGDPGYDAGSQHGIVATVSDTSLGSEWGCDGTLISGADGIVLGTGNQNTIDIVAGCPTAGIAARLCSDLVEGGYSDWYLPSKDELNKLYLNRVAIGSFVGTTYWSSSEVDSSNAEALNFFNGTQLSAGKINTYRVRAIRSF